MNIFDLPIDDYFKERSKLCQKALKFLNVHNDIVWSMLYYQSLWTKQYYDHKLKVLNNELN